MMRRNVSIYEKTEYIRVKKNAKAKMEQVQKRRMEMLISRLFCGQFIERNNCEKQKMNVCIACVHIHLYSTILTLYTLLIITNDLISFHVYH